MVARGLIYRVIEKVARKLNELIEGMEYNSFTTGNNGLRSNPEPV